MAQQQANYGQAPDEYHASLATFRTAKHQLGIMLCLSGIADCLAGIANLQAGAEFLRTAALLLAASDMLLEELSVLLMPADRAAHEASYRRLRARLGEGQFAAAWAEGQRLTLEQAIELALRAAQTARAKSAAA